MSGLFGEENVVRLIYGLLFLITVLDCAHAQIYTWVDEQGNTHFSDVKPKDRGETLDFKGNTYSSVTPQSASGKAAVPSKNVTMYSTSWCRYCKKARNYFRANNISFTEYDIEKSAAAKQAYDRINGKGVPVILVGKKRLNGFSESGFKRIYR